MATTIEVKGIPELSRSLNGMVGDLRDLSGVNGDVARDLVSAIRARAPRDTGRLAGSFEANGERDKAEASSELDYAGVQNYGYAAHNIAGQHFAEAALDATANGATAKYEREAERICRKAER